MSNVLEPPRAPPRHSNSAQSLVRCRCGGEKSCGIAAVSLESVGRDLTVTNFGGGNTSAKTFRH